MLVQKFRQENQEWFNVSARVGPFPDNLHCITNNSDKTSLSYVLYYFCKYCKNYNKCSFYHSVVNHNGSH